MKSLINGDKPQFGNRQQINWLKKQSRLKDAVDRGFIDAEVEKNPLGVEPIEKQVISVRFKCPGCLVYHKFSFPLLEEEYEYPASCGVKLLYDGRAEQLKVKAY